MSLKLKKKTPQADETEKPAVKKIKLPKAFIARPGPENLPGHASLSPQVAELLELKQNDFAVVAKDSGASLVALVKLDTSIDANVLCLSQSARSVAGILLGDRLHVSRYQKQPPYAETVKIYADCQDEDESILERATLWISNSGIVMAGMSFMIDQTKVTITTCESPMDTVTLKVQNLSLDSGLVPADVSLVSSPYLFNGKTKVAFSDGPLDYAAHPRLPRPVSLEHVGGLAKPVALLRSTVNLPLHHPTLFSDFGISPPRGILLHGPPGTGKTMLIRCVAAEADAHVLMVNGPSIVSKYLGESENALREIFAEAIKFEPAIIFMDEIDSLAPRRGSDDAGETESRVVATLLTMMDGMGESGRVVVVGATNRPNAVDPALRRPGRFDQEVEVGIPDAEARHDILSKQLARMNPDKCGLSDENIAEIALQTHGYVGADLAALCREAVMKTIARGLGGAFHELHVSGLNHLDPAVKVEKKDVEAALLEIRPSAMREIFLEMPKVSWDDIGGQLELKKKLTEVVQLPLEAAETFANLGISAPKGVLLYGPPGCSKTLTAKALASESGLNFLAVKGPEIFNKYVGESERTIREIFRKARAAAPSIIFFDEIDALASSRDEGASTLAAQHVLTSLLNEIDGVEELNGVVIVAATNRPSEIDPALLRPGRLDRHIYVAPPDWEGRHHIISRKCASFAVDGPESLFKRMADATDGCSGAEVALLCQEAGLAAIMENKNTRAVQEKHFDHALALISRGITREMLDYYEEFSSRSGLSM